MRYHVTRMRAKGRAIDKTQLRRTEGIRGDVHVQEAQCEALGRSARVARITPALPLDDSQLPPLMDVTLAWMANNGMVLSGIEIEDGVAYAQSWLCHPE